VSGIDGFLLRRLSRAGRRIKDNCGIRVTVPPTMLARADEVIE
jgi:hypothetical protein